MSTDTGDRAIRRIARAAYAPLLGTRKLLERSQVRQQATRAVRFAQRPFGRASAGQIRRYEQAKHAVYAYRDFQVRRGVHGDDARSAALHRRMTEARRPLGPLQVERVNWRVMDTRDRSARQRAGRST